MDILWSLLLFFETTCCLAKQHVVSFDFFQNLIFWAKQHVVSEKGAYQIMASICKIGQKNANFQFLINQPIRPIIMFYELEKVSISNFKPILRYQGCSLVEPPLSGALPLYFGILEKFEIFSKGFTQKWHVLRSVALRATDLVNVFLTDRIGFANPKTKGGL